MHDKTSFSDLSPATSSSSLSSSAMSYDFLSIESSPSKFDLWFHSSEKYNFVQWSKTCRRKTMMSLYNNGNRNIMSQQQQQQQQQKQQQQQQQQERIQPQSETIIAKNSSTSTRTTTIPPAFESSTNDTNNNNMYNNKNSNNNKTATKKHLFFHQRYDSSFYNYLNSILYNLSPNRFDFVGAIVTLSSYLYYCYYYYLLLLRNNGINKQVNMNMSDNQQHYHHHHHRHHQTMMIPASINTSSMFVIVFGVIMCIGMMLHTFANNHAIYINHNTSLQYCFHWFCTISSITFILLYLLLLLLQSIMFLNDNNNNNNNNQLDVTTTTTLSTTITTDDKKMNDTFKSVSFLVFLQFQWYSVQCIQLLILSFMVLFIQRSRKKPTIKTTTLTSIQEQKPSWESTTEDTDTSTYNNSRCSSSHDGNDDDDDDHYVLHVEQLSLFAIILFLILCFVGGLIVHVWNSINNDNNNNYYKYSSSNDSNHHHKDNDDDYDHGKQKNIILSTILSLPFVQQQLQQTQLVLQSIYSILIVSMIVQQVFYNNSRSYVDSQNDNKETKKEETIENNNTNNNNMVVNKKHNQQEDTVITNKTKPIETTTTKTTRTTTTTKVKSSIETMDWTFIICLFTKLLSSYSSIHSIWMTVLLLSKSADDDECSASTSTSCGGTSTTHFYNNSADIIMMINVAVVVDSFVLTILLFEVLVSYLSKRQTYMIHPIIVVFMIGTTILSSVTTSVTATTAIIVLELIFIGFYYWTIFLELSLYTNEPIFTTCINVYCDGIYDLCHIGHMRSFQYASTFGQRLYVGVCNDNDTSIYKRKPIMNEVERYTTVAACKYVTNVIPNAPCFGISYDFIIQYNIHIVAIGEEYIAKYPNPENDPYYKLPRQLGIVRIVPRTNTISTSDLIQRIQQRYQQEQQQEKQQEEIPSRQQPTTCV